MMPSENVCTYVHMYFYILFKGAFEAFSVELQNLCAEADSYIEYM
jgi:hypothetical protein